MKGVRWMVGMKVVRGSEVGEEIDVSGEGCR